MPDYKPIDLSVKAEILDQIRNQGVSVSEAAASHNVSPKTIYTWLRTGVVDDSKNLILENNRLKKSGGLRRLAHRETACSLKGEVDSTGWILHMVETAIIFLLLVTVLFCSPPFC